MKTLASLNKKSRPFSKATIGIWCFPLFLPSAITAFGGPEEPRLLNLSRVGFVEFRLRHLHNWGDLRGANMRRFGALMEA